MKKILVLNYEFPPLGGGASPVSYEIAKGYARLGHQVDVITMGFKNIPRFEIKDNINIYRVRCWRSKKEMCYPHEQLTYLIPAYRLSSQLHKKRNYDICHTHFLIPTGVIAYWLFKRHKLPYIVTSHGSDVPGYNPDRFSFLHKFTGPILKSIAVNSKYVVAPSQYLKRLIKKNISNNLTNLIYIPNGIDPDSFLPNTKNKSIFTSGRLLRRKGFQHLITAVADNDIGYQVNVCGDGPMMNKLNEIAAQSKTKIVFHGWLDNKSQKYINLLEQAAIYVLVSERENASIALLEAMSAGCAMITSDVYGCAETVNGAGTLLPPNNPEKIRQAIWQLINHPDEMKRSQNIARERVKKMYDWKIIIEKYDNILK
ncbi:glycosyltransferase family 4 protein [Patescibacteria group bacterium]